MFVDVEIRPEKKYEGTNGISAFVGLWYAFSYSSAHSIINDAVPMNYLNLPLT